MKNKFNLILAFLFIFVINAILTSSAQIQLIDDFESQSLTDWTIENQCVKNESLKFPITLNRTLPWGMAIDSYKYGNYYLEFYCTQYYDGCSYNSLYRNVTVPENANYLIYYWDHSTDDTCHGFSKHKIESLNGSIILDTGWIKPETINCGGPSHIWIWNETKINIEDYRNQEIKLWFGIKDDGDTITGNFMVVDYLYFELEPQVPSPTNRSLIITSQEWKNVISVAPVKVPVLVADKLNAQIEKYIEGYNPDHVYTLGFSAGLENSYEIGYEDVPELFFPNSTKAIYVENRTESVFASSLAYYLDIPVIFNKTKYNFSKIMDLSEFSAEEIQSLYLEEMKKIGDEINYLVLTNLNDNSSLFSGRISGLRKGYVVGINSSLPQYPSFDAEIESADYWNNLNSVEKTRGRIREDVERLESLGLFYGEGYYHEGGFVLILGQVPHIVMEDPVEESYFTWNDPEDSNWFLSDMDYGDLNDDGYLDLAVGRIPGMEQASLIFSKIELGNSNKKALVVAEYLHKYWPITLLYLGGGMWQGKNMETILEGQTYNVTRLIEYRFDLDSLILDVELSSIGNLLIDAERVSEIIQKLLGKTIAKAVSSGLIFIKGLRFIEYGLEIYLEYDWDSWTANLETAWQHIDEAIINPPGNQEEFIAGIFYLLFPQRLPELTNENLLTHIPDSEVIYYEGFGNGTDWILPNEYNEWDVFSSPYDGSNTFNYQEIPGMVSRMVWDNSNLGIRNFGSVFLEKGSLSYIGSSAAVYSPYSSEIDTRFFNYEKTVGQSLLKALNSFREDWFTWDPINWALRGDSAKAKSLREFILLGDPGMEKDPVINENYEPKVRKFCSFGCCFMTVTFSPDYDIVEENGEKSIVFDSDEHLLEAYKPILPLFRFEYYLPEDSRVFRSGKFLDFRSREKDIFVPVLIPVSHGGEIRNESYNLGSKTYPEDSYRIGFNSLADDRNVFNIVFSPLQMKGDSATIHRRTNFYLVYKTPLEMWINDYRNSLNIRIKNMQRKPLKGKLVVEISNGNNSHVWNKTVELRCYRTGNYRFCLDNLEEGYYQARLFYFGEDGTVLGPRYHYFSI
jgi:hypothetical protein